MAAAKVSAARSSVLQVRQSIASGDGLPHAHSGTVVNPRAPAVSSRARSASSPCAPG
jgi:hypothetical protein